MCQGRRYDLGNLFVPSRGLQIEAPRTTSAVRRLGNVAVAGDRRHLARRTRRRAVRPGHPVEQRRELRAIAVARATLREGLDALPAAQLRGPELDLRLLVDHRERLVRQRVALNNTLQWHLHDLWPELQLPGSSLFYGNWAPRVARRPARAEQTMRVRIARDELRRIRELSQTIKALEAEIAQLVAELAPHLLTEPGFGPLTAAKLVGEIAGASRFASDAKLARAAGVAPIPVSSGKTNHHRLDRGGNRQINATIHRIAITRRVAWKAIANRSLPLSTDAEARREPTGRQRMPPVRPFRLLAFGAQDARNSR